MTALDMTVLAAAWAAIVIGCYGAFYVGGRYDD